MNLDGGVHMAFKITSSHLLKGYICTPGPLPVKIGNT